MLDFVKRLNPTIGDLGVVVGSPLMLLLTGAAPNPSTVNDLHSLLMPLLMTGATTVAGLGAKAGLMTLWNLFRAWRQKDPTNILAEAAGMTADRMDPIPPTSTPANPAELEKADDRKNS